MRTILIGDIHGCYDEYKELLEKVNFNSKTDKLIILGDFIDKGPKSYELINEFYELDKVMKERLVLIMGNHEYEFLYHGYNIFLRILLTCLGRSKTKKSFKNNNKKINYFDKFLNNKLVTYYEDDLFQCAHATIIDENIKNNSKYNLVVNRFHTSSNKYDGKLTIVGHITINEPIHYKGNKNSEVLVYEKEKKLPKNGIIAIDTGCYYGNKLTAMIINDDKYKLEYVRRSI